MQVSRDPTCSSSSSGDQRLHYFEHTALGRALCRTERYIEDHAALRTLICAAVRPLLAALMREAPSTR